jgi:hypothetical protein
MSNGPDCFVSIPFGKKVSRQGDSYDFDRIYSEGIRPAALMASADCIRTELELDDPFEKRRLEHLVTSSVFVADVTTGNPSVYYDIGIRHAAKRRGTIIIAAHSEFGIPPVFAESASFLRYQEQDGVIARSSLEDFKKLLAQKMTLEIAEQTEVSSPVFQLFEGFEGIKLESSGGAKIFLSYAREDEARVAELYDQLIRRGFRPWLDQRDILPGEQWDPAIKKALKSADFIFVCLSASSVKKRGYLRREIADALERSKEMLANDIFLVPVRLDDCDIPEELQSFQWEDLFRNEALDRIDKALRSGLKRRQGNG